MVKPQCFMVQAMKSWPVGTKFLRGHDHEPQATAHLEKGWKPGGGPKFPDHQPLGELMSMALQSNPQWDAENGVCEATSSGTSPSPTTKHYVDLRVHPHLRGYKRRKLLQAPVPMLIGVVHIPIKGTKKTKKVKALVDSGASHCFLVSSIAKHFKRSSSLRQHAFATVAGPVNPKARTQVKFKLPELSSSAKFQAHFYVSDELCGYDMILGRDFLREIKLDILFSEDVLRWNDMDIRMKPSEECAKEAGAIAYSERFASKYGRRYEYEGEDDPLEGEILRLKDLADARYKPPDIDDYVETMEHLDDDEKLKVKALLVKHMNVLDGKLGTWVGKPISLATSSGTSPSPTTKHYVDLRVHPHLRGYKRRKLLQAPVPMLIGVVHIPIKGTKKTKKVKALVDSGASHCFLVTSIAKHFKRSSSLRQHAFATVAGPVKPKARTQVKFKLPELSSSAKFQAHFYVSDELCGYDMILGRDFLREIKLDILFSEDVLRWNDMDIRMKPSEECAKEAGAIAYSERFASKYGRRYEYEGEDDPLEGEILRLKDLADARYNNNNALIY
jgi:uncharacterized protein YdhG (YjbR/CyaY superfamily)